MTNDELKMTKIVSWAKRRGFVWQADEKYGGNAGVYGYGYYGALLKNNLKNFWLKKMVQERDDMILIDNAIITHQTTLEKSGHAKGFSDPLIECKKCHKRFRQDQIKGECPDCGSKDFTEEKQFNLMLETHLGPVADENSLAYLRPETAQGIFTNYENIMAVNRQKLPFGVAQIGKAFRNEINAKDYLFRTREFEQYEIEYFVNPDEAEKSYQYWVKERLDWYLSLGLKKENLRLREHEKKELAHYAAAATDVEYNFPFGWSELEGIANRTDFDLKAHFPEMKEIPYVIEPSGGVDRTILALLCDALEEVEARTTTTEAATEKEFVLRLAPELAPIKAAVFPLVKKEELTKIAREIYQDLKKEMMVEYDESGSIGRRYRRQDEIGTPYCITVDFETLKDGCVTVRDRDSMKQERVKIEELKEKIRI